MPVQMELSRILIRETDHPQVVELREVGGTRIFPIVIGIVEAAAIERRLMGDAPPRPQTHELLANIIEQLGAKIEKVIISDLQHDHLGNGTFFARLYLQQNGQLIDVDARPSDALALAVDEDIPIYVEDDVLNTVCNPDIEEDEH